ncbi:MAG TPA: hypothetical protein VF772_13780, partial [Terriglobales bacterium]
AYAALLKNYHRQFHVKDLQEFSRQSPHVRTVRRTSTGNSNGHIARSRGAHPILGADVLDSMYGNLEQALVAFFRSYSIDFSMQLCAGEPQDHVQ